MKGDFTMKTVLNGFLVSTEPANRGYVLLTIAKGDYKVYYQVPLKEEDVTDTAIELTIKHNAVLSILRLEALIPKEGGDIAKDDIYNLKRAIGVHSHCQRCDTPLLTRVLYPCPVCRKEFIK